VGSVSVVGVVAFVFACTMRRFHAHSCALFSANATHTNRPTPTQTTTKSHSHTRYTHNTTPVEDDVILQKELDELAAKHDNITVKYVFSAPKRGAPKGYITESFLKAELPAPSDQLKVFVCGPPGFYKAISGVKNPDKSQGELDGYLKNLGFTKDQVLKF
jgi:Oxidoreductase NAD-binding domain